MRASLIALMFAGICAAQVAVPINAAAQASSGQTAAASIQVIHLVDMKMALACIPPKASSPAAPGVPIPLWPGAVALCTATLSAAPAAGLTATVTLSTADPLTIVSPSVLTIPSGLTVATFTLTGK